MFYRDRMEDNIRFSILAVSDSGIHTSMQPYLSIVLRKASRCYYLLTNDLTTINSNNTRFQNYDKIILSLKYSTTLRLNEKIINNQTPRRQVYALSVEHLMITVKNVSSVSSILSGSNSPTLFKKLKISQGMLYYKTYKIKFINTLTGYYEIDPIFYRYYAALLRRIAFKDTRSTLNTQHLGWDWTALYQTRRNSAKRSTALPRRIPRTSI